MDLLKNQIHVTSLGDALSSRLLDYRSRDTVPSLESYCEDNLWGIVVYLEVTVPIHELLLLGLAFLFMSPVSQYFILK